MERDAVAAAGDAAADERTGNTANAGNSGDSSGKSRNSRPGRGVDFPLRILVSSDMVGAIIGRGGATIRNITQESRARVDVHSRRKMEPASGQLGQLEKAITVYGQPENCSAACKRILEVMEEEARNVGKEQDICLKILAHNNLIGRIIGKQGATIKKIMEDTSTKITVSSISDISSFNLERVISIRGSIPNISKAESEVSTKLRAAYETDLQAMAPQTMMFPGLHPAAMMSTAGLGTAHPYRGGAGGGGVGGGAGGGGSNYSGSVGGNAAGPANRQPNPAQIPTETSYLYIPNAAVGAVIGTKGSHIRNIIKFSGSTVKISPADEEVSSNLPGLSTSGGAALDAQHGSPATTEAASEQRRKVTVVGNPESQWKAQYLIFEKLREEGFSSGVEDVKLTVEIMVPSAQVGRIIGKGGQNVREMQRLTGAVIKLPEQGTSTGEETSVHIIGSFYSTQSAQRRIRAMVVGPGPHLPNGAPGAPGQILDLPIMPN